MLATFDHQQGAPQLARHEEAASASSRAQRGQDNPAGRPSEEGTDHWYKYHHVLWPTKEKDVVSSSAVARCLRTGT